MAATGGSLNLRRSAMTVGSGSTPRWIMSNCRNQEIDWNFTAGGGLTGLLHHAVICATKRSQKSSFEDIGTDKTKEKRRTRNVAANLGTVN
jgi:hypothetical protein